VKAFKLVPYRPEIDGLRALAVMPVILFHGGFQLFGGGYVGVDVFFVISGFLITSIIVAAHAVGKFSIAEFYERRARRILPALFLVMLVCIPIAWVWMLPDELASFGQSLVAVALFVSNILFWRTTGYFDIAADLKPLLHTWSLGVEEQFYVVYPLLVALCWRFGVRWLSRLLLCAAIISFLACDRMLTQHAIASFYLSPPRAWELFAGALLALAPTSDAPRSTPPTSFNQWLAASGLALILVPVFLYGNMTPFPGRYSLPPVVGTLLVLAFASPETWVGRFLTLRFMLWVGSISYGAYLWHQPLFAFARLISVNRPPQWLFGLLAIAALALAHLCWRFVERPFRNRTNWSRRGIWAWAGAGTFLFVCAGGSFVIAHGVPTRWNPGVRALIIPPKTSITSCPATDTWLRVCNIGAPLGSPTVVLLGDSHADAIATVLGEALARRNQAGYLVHTDCFPIPGMYDSREPLTAERRGYCAEADRRVREFIAQPGVVTVVVAVRWTLRLYPLGSAPDMPGFDNQEGGIEDTPYRETGVFDAEGHWNESTALKADVLRNYIQTLAAVRKTVLLYPLPEVGWTPARINLDAVAVGGGPPRYISTSWTRFRERNSEVEQLLDGIESPRIQRLHPADLFCDTFLKDRCVAQANGILYYGDDNHLSLEGARLVVERLMMML
jgi:peptidoglycan/LPS O-acetylase OafA/YrhL